MKWLTALAGVAAFAASAPAAVPPDLTGPEWTLSAINGVVQTGDRRPTVAFTLDPVPGASAAALSGYSGCNRYFGTYALAPGGKISIQVRGMTKMACERARMVLEREFQSALGAAASYEWRYDKTLTLLSSDGKMRLDFKQAAAKSE